MSAGVDRAIDTLSRHPITAVVLLSEAAFILASLGTPPLALWRVLVIPAYVTHLLLAFVVGPGYWIHFAVTLMSAYGLDRLTQRWRSPGPGVGA